MLKSKGFFAPDPGPCEVNKPEGQAASYQMHAEVVIPSMEIFPLGFPPGARELRIRSPCEVETHRCHVWHDKPAAARDACAVCIAQQLIGKEMMSPRLDMIRFEKDGILCDDWYKIRGYTTLPTEATLAPITELPPGVMPVPPAVVAPQEAAPAPAVEAPTGAPAAAASTATTADDASSSGNEKDETNSPRKSALQMKRSSEHRSRSRSRRRRSKTRTRESAHEAGPSEPTPDRAALAHTTAGGVRHREQPLPPQTAEGRRT